MSAGVFIQWSQGQEGTLAWHIMQNGHTDIWSSPDSREERPLPEDPAVSLAFGESHQGQGEALEGQWMTG